MESAPSILCFAVCALIAFAQTGETRVNGDPNQAKFVTSDIDNFSRAFDLATKETDREKKIAVYQTEYLDKGSVELQDFIRMRIKKNKRQAIRDVLNIKDFSDFFKKSRYGQQFSAGSEGNRF